MKNQLAQTHARTLQVSPAQVTGSGIIAIDQTIADQATAAQVTAAQVTAAQHGEETGGDFTAPDFHAFAASDIHDSTKPDFVGNGVVKVAATTSTVISASPGIPELSSLVRPADTGVSSFAAAPPSASAARGAEPCPGQCVVSQAISPSSGLLLPNEDISVSALAGMLPPPSHVASSTSKPTGGIINCDNLGAKIEVDDESRRPSFSFGTPRAHSAKERRQIIAPRRTRRTIGVQTDISLPQRVDCIWQNHVVQRQNVVDSASANAHRAKPSEITSSSSDADSSDEVLERVNDLRQLSLSDQAGATRSVSNVEPEVEHIAKPRVVIDGSPMFEFDELDMLEEMKNHIEAERREAEYVYVAEDEMDSDGDQIPDIVHGGDDHCGSLGGRPPPTDEPGRGETSFREMVDRASSSIKAVRKARRSATLRCKMSNKPRRRCTRLVHQSETKDVVATSFEHSSIIGPRDGFFDFDALNSDESLDEPEPQPDVSDRDIMAVARGASKVGGRRMRMARGITVDSGAADNVMPRRMMRKGMRIRPSEASRAGVHYVAANGSRIPNEGETNLKFEDKDGVKHSWLFQVAEVNKVLASVSSMVDSGHRVVFDKDEVTGMDLSFIICKKTGSSVKMKRERNVWIIDAFVDGSDFSRQE